jgi:hypothetical protein
MDGPIDAADVWPPPDPLGEALHILRMDGASYCRSELTAPWGTTLDPMPGYLWFHVVTTGGALLEVDRDHARWLHPGDVALVPQANGHILRSEPGVPARGSWSWSWSIPATATRSSATAAARPRP